MRILNVVGAIDTQAVKAALTQKGLTVYTVTWEMMSVLEVSPIIERDTGFLGLLSGEKVAFPALRVYGGLDVTRHRSPFAEGLIIPTGVQFAGKWIIDPEATTFSAINMLVELFTENNEIRAA